MQDDHSRDFDLQLRSMLEDATVKPSRRVWKGVSSRLDADSVPAASPWGWMKWAGMSLAAAAVVAAALFFTGTRHSIPTNYNNQEQVQLAQAGEPAGAPLAEAAPAAAPAEDAAEVAAATKPARRSSDAAARSAAPIVSVADDSAAEAPAPILLAESEDQVTPQETKDSGEASTGEVLPVKEQQIPVTDPFVEPYKPARKASFDRKASLYAQGTLGSNDSDFRPIQRSAYMAPGEPSGFTELGAPTYGIPFTVGVGVRFYVAPRLSLGTGLDYSLLTRTFTGRFEDISGSVTHSMHYLGVPLKLYYDVISSDRIKFYVYGGGEAEYCIVNKYRLFASPDIIRTEPVAGPQFSVGGGLGVEFRLTRQLGLYFDPGANYYFPGNQPRSIRTDKPFLLNFDAGLRFNFGR